MSFPSFRSSRVLTASVKHCPISLGLILFLLAFVHSAGGQMQTVSIITTAAGNGTAGFTGDGGLATAASFNFPRGPAIDSSGNLYISDYNNHRVRKITPGGTISTFAGGGATLGDGGPATSAALSNPEGIAVDSGGNVYICDYTGQRIRKVDAATGNISTIAGTGTGGFSGDGGPATTAQLSGPMDPNFDSAGNLYFADYYNNRVRKITMATGVISTVAGNGVAATTGNGGPATGASLHGPVSTVFDTTGNLYISERDGYVVRRVAAGTGIISTFAGIGAGGSAGDGGPATSANVQPYGIAFDIAGNVLISDPPNNRVRMVNISTGIITTVAGNGTGGFSGDGGAATSATLNGPVELVTDPYGHVYICDAGNNRIREITLSTTFPATAIGSSSVTRIVQLQATAAETISSIVVPQSQGGKQEYNIGTITGCIVDGSTTNPVNTVCNIPITFTPAYPGRRWIPLQVVTSTGNINFGLTGIGIGPLAVLTPGIITTVVGNGTGGYAGDGGAASSAQIFHAYRQIFDNAGNMYIADSSNHRIRKVAVGTGIITTIAGTGTAGYSGDGGLATGAQLYNPQGVALDSAGNLYIADYSNSRVRKVTTATGIITTVAGNGTYGYAGDGGAATSAELLSPDDVAFDSPGNLYIADYNGNRVRKVAVGTGIITTIAGNGTAGYSGDGAAAASAVLNSPVALAIDTADNLYIADQANFRVRKVTATTGIITTVAGNGTAGSAGDGGSATSAQLRDPGGIAVDTAGNLYIGDEHNNKVRKVDAGTGVITTFAGTGSAGFSGDGGVATQAQLNAPLGVAFDGPGNLFFSDLSNNRIRKLDLSQSALTYPTATTVGTLDATDNPQTAIVSNIGNATLTISTPSSGNNPSVAANFTFNPSSTCPQLSSSSGAQTLASGANCTIAIDFAPNQAGAITGSAVLTDTSLNAAAVTQTIHLSATGVAASTTTTLVGTPNPAVYSQTVVFTATVAPTTGTALPTGSVQFSVDGTPVGGPVALSGGSAAFASNTLSAGTHAVTAVYTPDTGNFTTSNGSFSQTVNPESTTTTVASSLNPSPYMQSVTFTATVAQTTGTTQPTGAIQFSVDGTPVGGLVTLSGGVATYTISTLAVGLHTITAAYTPSPTNFTASSGSLGQRVGAAASSTTTLTVAPTTVMYGNPAALTAVVAPSFATGTVSFYEGATLLGTASLDNTGTAVLPISTLNAGVHTITAKYNGDPGVPASTSNTAQLTVTQRTAPDGSAAITITVNDASRTTTQSNPPFTYSPSGQLVNGDTYATAISGTPSYATAAGTSAGAYSITVSGLTSQNYSIAFVPGTLTVTTSPSTTTLVASPTSTQYGDPVTLTATVTSGATGTVNFFDGSILLGTGTVSNGIATLTTTTLVAGTHSVTAVYNGDATYASSQSGPATVTVAKKQGAGGGAALTITIQNASREYNTSDPQFAYVVTGALVNGDSYATAITGPPVYSSTDTPTSPAGSTFPISVSGLSSANYEIAVVNGTLTIVNAPTTTTLIISTAAAQYGDPVTLTATVAPSGATGTVVFLQGSTVLGTAIVTNGVATLTTSALNAGSYTITASYQGDGNYGASTSTPAPLTINPRTGPGGGAALTITVQDASRFYGQGNPAFTYTVTGSLMNGDTYSTAITGVPVYSTPGTPTSAAGNYPVSVSGLNAANYVVAFVNGTLTVSKATTSTNNVTLTSTPDPAVPNQPVTFTATVPPGATGTVTFMDGSVVLGTATITNGIATLTTTLPSGTHSVSAVYNGDANHTGTTSNVATVIVGQASALDFTLTLTSSGTQTVMPGEAAPYAVRVAPTSTAYPGTVAFSAMGLPPGATISFSPATVAANAGPTPSNVTVQTAPQKATLDRENLGSMALALLVLPFATSRRIRRSGKRYLFVMLLLLGSMAAATSLTGCGYNGNGFFGQAPKTYNITITATSANIQHSVNVTLNVQ